MTDQFSALGKPAARFAGLETFLVPAGVERVVLESDEVTSVCPITAQPDWYTVTIAYTPRERCLETKSLKLYFETFRDQGIFCEDFSARIAGDLSQALLCPVEVTVFQKRRGGITIAATARAAHADPG